MRCFMVDQMPRPGWRCDGGFPELPTTSFPELPTERSEQGGQLDDNPARWRTWLCQQVLTVSKGYSSVCSATPAKDPARQWWKKDRGEVWGSHSSHSRSSTVAVAAVAAAVAAVAAVDEGVRVDGDVEEEEEEEDVISFVLFYRGNK